MGARWSFRQGFIAALAALCFSAVASAPAAAQITLAPGPVKITPGPTTGSFTATKDAWVTAPCDATLIVRDATNIPPIGHAVNLTPNGPAAMPLPLQAGASSPSLPGSTRGPVSGSPSTLITWTAPTVNEPIVLHLHQSVITPIGFGEVYWKDLTFTLASMCGPPSSVTLSLYVDPSGWVHDTDGKPLAGAKVTLLHAPGPAGPFTEVPDGSKLMSEQNRANPDYTSSDGSFRWDVVDGHYKVKASYPGCVDPDDPSKDYVETAPLEIPPEVTGLVLVLKCPVPSVSALAPAAALVDPTLEVSLGAPPFFGRLTPGVGGVFNASALATVTSSGEGSVLSVADPSNTAPGRLVNGRFALGLPMEIRAGTTTRPAGGFRALNVPLDLLDWADPVAREIVTLDFRQVVGPTEPLRSGAYRKTLVFTLTATSP